MNFKEIRELLTLCYAVGYISDEEFLLLYEAHTLKNQELPYKEYGRFQLESMDEAE